VAVGLAYLLQNVACTWEILELTSSPFYVGLMAAAPMVPLPLLSLFAGAIADRCDRRRLIIMSTSFMSAVAASMATAVAIDAHTPALLVMMAMATGIGIAFFDPSWLASIADLVPRRLLVHAVALSASGNAVIWAAGSALGGALVATSGVARTLMVTSAGYATMAIASFIGPNQHRIRAEDRTTVWSAVAAGIRYLQSQRALVSLLSIIGLFALSALSIQTLLPVLTKDALHGGSALYGLLLASFGVGSIIGLLTRRSASELLNNAMIPVTILVFSVNSFAVSVAANAGTIAALLVVAGALWTWVLATIGAAIQLLAPSSVRARVMSIYALTAFGSMSIGSLLAGTLANALGPRTALLTCSIATALVGLVARRLRISQAGLGPPRPTP
jgi:MFS family permease